MPFLSELDLDQTQATSPNNSYLETCVLLWSLGDYFCLPDLCQLVLSLLVDRCRKLFIESRSVCNTFSEISFLPDLEAGVRAAWNDDRAPGPVRLPLMFVCRGLHPVLRNQNSFINLLEEIPKFSIDFLKALLGCDGLQLRNPGKTKAMCFHCGFRPPAGSKEEEEFFKNAFLWTPIALDLYSEHRRLYCSKECLEKGLGTSIQSSLSRHEV